MTNRSADWSGVDIKRLHEVIKELRAELDRVNQAIYQIEKIAATANGEQRTSTESSENPPAGDQGKRG